MKIIKSITLLTIILFSTITPDRLVSAQTNRQIIDRPKTLPKSPPLLWTGSYTFSEGRGRIRILQNGLERYGYIDRTGKIVIQPKYLFIGNFSQGLAPVKFTNQKYGFINRVGKTVIAPKYDLAYGFVDGLAIVEINGKMGAIDRQGKSIVQPVYSHTAMEFQEGLLAVKQGNLWGFVNTQGHMAIDPQFVDPKQSQINEEDGDISNFCLLRFSEGLAAVTHDGVSYNYINKQGEIVIPSQFKYACAFSEGLSLVQTKNGEWGFVDNTGQLTIPLPAVKNLRIAEAALLSIFSQGLAGVKIGNKWGFIDRNGQQIIPPQFDNVYPFSEGLAGVVINGKYGFINRQGKMVIPPKFDRAFSFRSGLAPVAIGEYGTINARVGYINRLGKLVIQQRTRQKLKSS